MHKKKRAKEEPMDVLTQREKAFEEKYAHDEEIHFRIITRRNHLFGLWVAGLLGYYGRRADLYIEDLILASVQKASQKDILPKVLKDLQKAKVDLTEHQIRKQLENCEKVAIKMVMHEEEF